MKQKSENRRQMSEQQLYIKNQKLSIHGITLIALIITIIVMLILVAVTVRIVVNSGLFKHAGNATSGYNQQQARERLGTALASAMMEKVSNPTGFDLDACIKSELPDVTISDNIVIVDGWAFEIDRENLTIVQDLGKEGNYTFPSIISITSNIAENRETATLTITAEETEHGINKIEVLLDGRVVESFECGGSKEQVIKTTQALSENGKYVIKVYSELSISEVKEITELVSVTHLNVTSANSSDNTKATITITAKEAKNGIQKIVITKDGTTVTEIDCDNTKEQITRNYDVTENGTYTVTAYAENNATETVTITGLKVLTTDRTGLQVGDYINYTPDTASAYSLETGVSGYSSNQSIAQENLKWRVMNINADGSVDLISAVPTSKTVYFNNAIGYNNGVYVLNNLCKEQYSNDSLGTTARSLNLEDIEKKFNSAGINARNDFTSIGSVKYGGTKTYSGNYSYAPDIYTRAGKTTAEESKDYYTSPTTAAHEQKGTLEVKQTYYNIPVSSDYMDDKTFHQLIFSIGTTYWLASRYDYCDSSFASFGLRIVSSSTLYGYDLFYSGSNAHDRNCSVRPVVSLGSNVKISSEGGTEDSPRDISL